MNRLKLIEDDFEDDIAQVLGEIYFFEGLVDAFNHGDRFCEKVWNRTFILLSKKDKELCRELSYRYDFHSIRLLPEAGPDMPRAFIFELGDKSKYETDYMVTMTENDVTIRSRKETRVYKYEQV